MSTLQRKAPEGFLFGRKTEHTFRKIVINLSFLPKTDFGSVASFLALLHNYGYSYKSVENIWNIFLLEVRY